MAPSRRKYSARWVVLISSGAAVAAFFAAIVNGPQPNQTDLQQSLALGSASAQSRSFDGNGGATVAPSLSQPDSIQRSTASTGARLRTRGS